MEESEALYVCEKCKVKFDFMICPKCKGKPVKMPDFPVIGLKHYTIQEREASRARRCRAFLYITV
jgi:hypothetical protein